MSRNATLKPLDLSSLLPGTSQTLLRKVTEYASGDDAAEVAARYGMTVNNLRQVKHRIDRMIAAVEERYLF